MEDRYFQPSAYVCIAQSPAVSHVFEMNQGSTSFYHHRWRALQNEIADIFNECSKPNWDGEGAAPVSPAAAANAIKVAATLPLNVELPSLFPTNAGKISFQWVSKDKTAMMISLDGQERISYAAVLRNGERRNGSKAFWGTLPGDIAGALLLVGA